MLINVLINTDSGEKKNVYVFKKGYNADVRVRYYNYFEKYFEVDEKEYPDKFNEKMLNYGKFFKEIIDFIDDLI